MKSGGAGSAVTSGLIQKWRGGGEGGGVPPLS